MVWYDCEECQTLPRHDDMLALRGSDDTVGNTVSLNEQHLFYWENLLVSAMSHLPLELSSSV